MKFNTIRAFGVCILTVLPIYSWADTTFVYCVSQQDSGLWHWLYDNEGEIVHVNGQWQRLAVDEHYTLQFFSMNVTEITKLKCPQGFAAQPADSASSRWYLFRLLLPHDRLCLLEGYMSKHFLPGDHPNYGNNDVELTAFYRGASRFGYYRGNCLQ